MGLPSRLCPSGLYVSLKTRIRNYQMDKFAKNHCGNKIFHDFIQQDVY